MKKVTLYQVSKTDKIVSGDHLELSSYGRDQITPIRNSGGEFVIHNGYEKAITLPIQKFVFCQKHWKTGEVDQNIIYAVFDEELLKLIQCERDEFENLNNSLIVKCAEIGDLKAKNLQLEDRLVKANKAVDKVNQMGFWKRLVYLFKGKKVFK